MLFKTVLFLLINSIISISYAQSGGGGSGSSGYDYGTGSSSTTTGGSSGSSGGISYLYWDQVYTGGYGQSGSTWPNIPTGSGGSSGGTTTPNPPSNPTGQANIIVIPYEACPSSDMATLFRQAINEAAGQVALKGSTQSYNDIYKVKQIINDPTKTIYIACGKQNTNITVPPATTSMLVSGNFIAAAPRATNPNIYSMVINVTLFPTVELNEQKEVLVHEGLHWVTPISQSGIGHGIGFDSSFILAAATFSLSPSVRALATKMMATPRVEGAIKPYRDYLKDFTQLLIKLRRFVIPFQSMADYLDNINKNVFFPSVAIEWSEDLAKAIKVLADSGYVEAKVFEKIRLKLNSYSLPIIDMSQNISTITGYDTLMVSIADTAVKLFDGTSAANFTLSCQLLANAINTFESTLPANQKASVKTSMQYLIEAFKQRAVTLGPTYVASWNIVYNAIGP